MVRDSIALLVCDQNQSAIFWLLSAVVYYVSLYFTDKWMANQKPQETLHDRSFQFLPRRDSFVYLTDGIGIAGAVLLAYWILLCPDEIYGHAARESLIYSAIGNYFSASLHSVTLLPCSDHTPSVTPSIIFGGHSDKLMSNHAFHFGLYLRLLSIVDIFPREAIPICILVYSGMLSCTRSHYACDIVLAWWALALVFMSAGFDAPDRDICPTEI
jgi:hypothetical protein